VAAGLRTDPLGELERSPDPVAVLGGEMGHPIGREGGIGVEGEER